MGKSREDIIREIRAIGESIIKNAESIAGTEEYLREIYIQAEVSMDDKAPNISISRSFMPEKCAPNVGESGDDHEWYK